LKRAAEARLAAERARDTAGRDLDESTKALRRSGREQEAVAKQLEDLGSEIAAALGGESQTDPVGVLSERLEELLQHTQTERVRAREADEAVRARDAAERDLELVRAEIGAERTRLELDLRPFVQRARRAAGTQLSAPSLPRLPATTAAADTLAGHAASVAEAIEGFAATLEERVAGRSSEEAGLFDEARRLAGDAAADAEDLPTLAAELHGEVRRAG